MAKPTYLRVLDLLISRCGRESVVELRNGSQLRVWNVAWGTDRGEEVPYVTTNGSPFVHLPDEDEPEPLVFFLCDEVATIRKADGTLLFDRAWYEDPDPRRDPNAS